MCGRISGREYVVSFIFDGFHVHPLVSCDPLFYMALRDIIEMA